VKKLWNVFVLTLAVNFLAAAGGVAYLYNAGRLDRARVGAIRDILYPPPAPKPAATTRPVGDAEHGPELRLNELLEQKSGLSTAEQLEFIQQTFDARMAEMDRRQREMGDLQRQVDMANAALARDRLALEAEKKALAERQQLADRLAGDKGFQDSLKLYKSMPPKQVKQVFLSMDDETVRRYLQAMEPRTATKIVREFKAPDEQQRIQRVLQAMGADPVSPPPGGEQKAGDPAKEQ
jgi:hypothetical protein